MINEALISVVGWLYFLLWSVSFYGQVVLNYRLKNVEGMNLDFLALNLTGYICYTIYCSYGFFCAKALPETGKVNLNDLFFVYHALLITIVMVVQAFIYPKGRNKINPITIGIILTISSFSVTYATLTYFLKCIQPLPYLSVISFMGYFKIAINFIKCWPQMMWNFERRSTKGWSTPANILDLVGGSFAFLQVAMEHHNNPTIQINLTKLALAAICMVYDAIFLSQRYCLYPEEDSQESKQLQRAKVKICGNEKQTERGWNVEAPKLEQYVIKEIF